MTRKRFIKMTMSYGYSRNKAIQLAKESIEIVKTYDRAYEHLIFASWLNSVS